MFDTIGIWILAYIQFLNIAVILLCISRAFCLCTLIGQMCTESFSGLLLWIKYCKNHPLAVWEQISVDLRKDSLITAPVPTDYGIVGDETSELSDLLVMVWLFRVQVECPNTQRQKLSKAYSSLMMSPPSLYNMAATSELLT